jgi:hypothetical protein
VSSDAKRAFGDIYRRGGFGRVKETVSGSGSTLGQTARLIAGLPVLFRQLGVRTLLDLPCGDYHWMRLAPLEGITYIGADVVPELISANRLRDPYVDFRVIDLVTDELPAADLLLCRDCLVHLPFADIQLALKNILRSPITYLMATTFPGRVNRDCRVGDWRPLDLEGPPFNLPRPVAITIEGCTEFGGRFRDKALGVWKLAR